MLKTKRVHLSLKIRLLLIVISALLVSLIGEIYLQAHNWKSAIRSEVDSSFTLAKRLVGSEFIHDEKTAIDVHETVAGALQGLRHIRVLIKYNHKSILSETDDGNMFSKAGVPEWFVNFIYPYQDSLPRVIITSNDYTSELIIEADPRDEIIEVWEDFRTQLIIISLFSFFVSVFIYVGLHIGLKPLNELLTGFEKLESGDFDVNLNEDISTELSHINQKFNHMAGVLKRTSEDNSILARKMVNLQEEERKILTHELHDEMAPHLFGIRVTTSKLNSLINQGRTEEIPEELNAIDKIVENLQTQMRRLLNRLRPLILDDLKINDAIAALFDKKEISELGINWQLYLEELGDDLDDTITVTLYRITQECVTNIVRHAEATEARITVFTKKHQVNKSLNICIEDNGVGMSSTTSHGFGLIGMRERIQALGGDFSISRSELGGVKITAKIYLS